MREGVGWGGVGGAGRESEKEREIPAVHYDAATYGYCFGRGPVFFLMRVR